MKALFSMLLLVQNGVHGFLGVLTLIGVIGGVICFALLISLAIWYLAQRRGAGRE